MRPPPGGGEPPQHARTRHTGVGSGLGAWMRPCSAPAGRPCTRPLPVGARTSRPRRRPCPCRPRVRPGPSACKPSAPGPPGSAVVPCPRPTGKNGHEADLRSKLPWGHGPVRSCGRPSLRRMFWRAVTALAPDAARWRRSETSPALGNPDAMESWERPLSKAAATLGTTPGGWTGCGGAALIGPCCNASARGCRRGGWRRMERSSPLRPGPPTAARGHPSWHRCLCPRPGTSGVTPSSRRTVGARHGGAAMPTTGAAPAALKTTRSGAPGCSPRG